MLDINGDFGSANTDSQGYGPRVAAERNGIQTEAPPSPAFKLLIAFQPDVATRSDVSWFLLGGQRWVEVRPPPTGVNRSERK